MTEKEKVLFDDILEVVGSIGPFQTRFNCLFNFLFLILVSMPNLNLFLIMAVPNHWCHVPGRENTNYTVEEWKVLTIPRGSSYTGDDFESCKMFVFSNASEYIFGPSARDDANISDCQYGWDFDRTWYSLTIPMERNWVCQKDIYVAHAFVSQRIGDVVGNFIFGQLGDTFGRMYIFYATLSTLVIGKLMLLLSTGSTVLFVGACFIGGLAVTAIFQSPLVIAMEVSKRETHAHVAMLQCLGWTVGFCVIPMIMWAMKYWVPFLLITSLPCGIYLFSSRYLIESPRWLYSKGKKAKCVKALKKIATVNNIEVGDELTVIINKSCKSVEKTYGIMSLFTHWRLAKNSIILIFGWSISNLIYYVLTLNIDKMGGNPFMNFFWQGLAELPGYVLGKMSCDKFGRKWTNILGFVGVFVGSVPIMFTIDDPTQQWATSVSAVFLKFCISYSFYAVNLHCLEIYPTTVRQSGCSLGGITANTIGVVGPYIVYLGTTINKAYPYIISAVLGLVCIVSALFLPETLNEKLPEELADAHVFGKDQPFFYIPNARTHIELKNKNIDL